MLNQERISDIVNKIGKTYNPKFIWLFGSYAKGSQTEDSDLDILIVDDSKRDKKQLGLDIHNDFFPRDYAMDVLVVRI